jgi:hypothetical protein
MKGSTVKATMADLRSASWEETRLHRVATLLESAESTLVAQCKRAGGRRHWCFSFTLAQRVRLQWAQEGYGRFGIAEDGLADGIYLTDGSSLADVERAARALGFTGEEMAQVTLSVARQVMQHHVKGANFVAGGLFDALEASRPQGGGGD